MATWTVWIVLMGTVLSEQGSKVQDCGVAPLNTKIVGGENATVGSWPWQVSMHVKTSSVSQHTCGGTLISLQWVLTAAHCIGKNSPGDWILYLGRETQTGPNVHEVSRSVSQVIVHPDYNNTLFNNDVALMRLSSPVDFTEYIRPVCLASNSSQVHNSTQCWVTGWGRLGKDEPLLPNSLQQVQVPVIGRNQCSCSYLPVTAVNITNEMICAGQENKGACQGDSGGPVQCKQGSSWIQVGITSFGIPCALGAFPEVFARVSQFQSWITDQVSGDNVGFERFTSTGTDPDNSFVCRTAQATTASVSSAVQVYTSQLLPVLFFIMFIN